MSDQIHRAVHSAEHDPANGRLHGYCLLCGVPYPCDYVGPPPTPEADKPVRHHMAICLDVESIRMRSGQVRSSDPLVTVFYLLMRDHLPTGVVAELCRTSLESVESKFTNGWLAHYARTLAAAVGQGPGSEPETKPERET